VSYDDASNAHITHTRTGTGTGTGTVTVCVCHTLFSGVCVCHTQFVGLGVDCKRESKAGVIMNHASLFLVNLFCVEITVVWS
jgi:hypothetical protein